MQPYRVLLLLIVCAACLATATARPTRSGAGGAAHVGTTPEPRELAADQVSFVQARVIAMGIPGAGTISPVGRFLPGGPIHDLPQFAALTQPGRVLDPNRILVGSDSNFGAPLGNPLQASGALLSIDPKGDTPIVVPPDFAAADGQASALGGRLQLYAAQSPAFLNGINTPAAVTASMASVSDPRGLSINNAFGRIWPANAPFGLFGAASEGVLDPTGIPLASAPDKVAGGVFAGHLTNRDPQLVAGELSTGAVATAFFGPSPDGSHRAVFAAVCADGSVLQIHVERGVDGLAPPGTITPLIGLAVPGRMVDFRLGAVLNFEPIRILYVTDPLANSVVALTLLDDGTIFRMGEVRRISSSTFNSPVGLAPVLPETEDTDWASNTTLFEGGDIYIANAGDNSIVRLRQDGTVVAAERVSLPGGDTLGNARLTGIATSTDGSRIWVTVQGSLPGFPGLEGAVLELPSFGGDVVPAEPGL